MTLTSQSKINAEVAKFLSKIDMIAFEEIREEGFAFYDLRIKLTKYAIEKIKSFTTIEKL